MDNRKKIILLILTTMALLLSACSAEVTTEPTSPPEPASTTEPTDMQEPEEPSETVNLKVSVLPFLSYGPFFIAQEEGYFAEQGLEVEFVRIDRTSEAMPALAQGQIDVAAGFFDVSTLNAAAKGGDIKYVSDKGYLDPDTCSAATWIARKDLLEDGTLDDYNNLAGMNVAITPTSSGEYFLDLLLQKGGLSIEDIVIQNIPLPARLDGLKNETTELAGVSDPWTVRMVNAGLGEVWEPWETYIPNFQFSLIMYGPNLLEENPEVGERFMMAYIKSVRQYNEGKTDRNVEIIAKHTQMDPVEVTQACWMAMKSDGRLTMIGMDEFQEWAASKGYIDSTIPSEQLVDNRFVEKANQVLGEP